MKLKDLIAQYGEQEVTNIYMNSDNSYGSITVKLEPPKPKTVWDLKEGDVFFVLYNDGDVKGYNWNDTGLCILFRDQGTIFLTREEGEAEKGRREVETLLLMYGGRRWYKKGDPNYYLWYDTDDEKLESAMDYDYAISGSIYFDTKEQAEKAIAEIGADRIKKALFEVR